MRNPARLWASEGRGPSCTNPRWSLLIHSARLRKVFGTREGKSNWPAAGRGDLTSGTTGQDLARSLFHEAGVGLGGHLRKAGTTEWAAMSGRARRPRCRACRNSSDRESRRWVGPCAEWLPVRRQSGDRSEAAAQGADSRRALRWVRTCPLHPFGGSLSPLPGPVGSKKDPGGKKTRGCVWVGGPRWVGFGLLDWRPRASLSGASCS